MDDNETEDTNPADQRQKNSNRSQPVDKKSNKTHLNCNQADNDKT